MVRPECAGECEEGNLVELDRVSISISHVDSLDAETMKHNYQAGWTRTFPGNVDVRHRC